MDFEGSDLLVVLGGPIGVYEEDAYPFLIKESALNLAPFAVPARVSSTK